MRRCDAGVGVQQFLIDFPATWWLRADEDVTEGHARDQQLAIVDHDAARRSTPAFEALDAVAGKAAGQGAECSATATRTVGQTGVVAVFQRLEIADRLEPLRVIGPLDQMVLESALEACGGLGRWLPRHGVAASRTALG